MCLSQGSIPEEDQGKLYNTCSVFGPDGSLLVKHRKVMPLSITVKSAPSNVPDVSMVSVGTDQYSLRSDDSSLCNSFCRFIFSTLMFQGRYVSRSQRPSALAVVCLCSTHVSLQTYICICTVRSSELRSTERFFLLCVTVSSIL